MRTILAASQAAAVEQAKAAPAVQMVTEARSERVEIKSFADLLTRIAKLSSEDQASLVCEVVEHLDAVHLHRVREVLDERTTPTRGPGPGSES